MAKNKYENLTEAEITELEVKRLERKVKRASEIKAFLILLVIILVTGGATWYWYTHIYDGNKNAKNNEVKDKYEVSMVEVSGNKNFKKVGKYILLIEGNNLLKVYDSIGNEYDVSDSKIGYDNYLSTVMNGIDGNLYAYNIEYAEYGGVTYLYKFNDGKFEKIKEIVSESVGGTYAPMIKRNGETDELIGFAMVEISMVDDDLKQQENGYYYILGVTDDIVKTSEFYIEGDVKRLAVDDTYITYNDTYITTSKGILNYMKNNHNEFVYTDIFSGIKNDYIVNKEDKYAIIDDKQELKTKFEFDFIAPFNTFYVVKKDGKLAIIDNNYKVVSDYEISYSLDYSNKPCCGVINGFEGYQVGSNYYLIGNFTSYENLEAYMIDSTGKVMELDNSLIWVVKKTSSGNYLIYSYDEDKVVTLYDKDFKKMYSIDYEDNSKIISLDLIDDNNLKVGSIKSVYYNYSNGERIENPTDIVIEEDGYSIKYNYRTSTVAFKENKEQEFKIDFIDRNDIFKDDDLYYVVSNKHFVYMKNKGN